MGLEITGTYSFDSDKKLQKAKLLTEMSSSDQIMLDSPAQTPDAKSHHPPNLRAGNTMAQDDMAMMVEDPIAETVGGWDTKKWREDLQIANSKLQHSAHFNPGKSDFETHSPWSR